MLIRALTTATLLAGAITAPAQATSTEICQPDHLAISMVRDAGQLPEIDGHLAITNTGAQACALTGDPALRLILSNGQPTETTVLHDLRPVEGATNLNPGSPFAIPMMWQGGPDSINGPTPVPTQLEVTFPGQPAKTVPWKHSSVWQNQLEVAPLHS
ncbi:DUF4232 domain-containing protein [Pseudonocardiaceae bacterium YIM PH 21723]|nr:DUF4232 domain-containing protein [Pseudonocardiaceae bacterium YIM PH 21723]